MSIVLTVGEVFCGDDIPHPLHWHIGIPPSDPLFEGSAYVLVNRETRHIEHYLIPPSNMFNIPPDGVSCMIRQDPNKPPHAVKRNILQEGGCATTTRLQPSLAAVVNQLQRSRVNASGKLKREDYHVTVFSHIEQTVDAFIQQLSGSNWSRCLACEPDEKKSRIGKDDECSHTAPTSKCTELTFLLRTLAAAGNNDTCTLRDECSRLLELLSLQVSSTTTFAHLIQEKSCAFRLYKLLYRLQDNIDPKNVSGLTKLQILIDAIDDMWDISENWYIINLCSEINKFMKVSSCVFYVCVNLFRDKSNPLIGE